MADTEKIREVRARTGVGFGDCKKALAEADWNVEVAIDIVRKQSSVKAEKKADRSASEGRLALKLSGDGSSGALVEVSSETDFAARSETFETFCTSTVDRVLADGEEVIHTMEEERQALVQVIGENCSIRRAARLQANGGAIAGYLHNNDLVGTLVEMQGGSAELGKDVAMHITAMNPLVVSGDDIPEEVLERERAIYVAQALETGKSEKIAQNIVNGRLNKFKSESSLLFQKYFRDPEITIGKLLKDHDATCVRFTRFKVGEAI